VRYLIILLSLVLGASPSWAQVSPEVKPDFTKERSLQITDADASFKIQDKEFSSRPTIVLIGYWPPTNEMLRKFSANPAQNPQGWKGENWEKRGYDVYSFFPEFPGGLGIGVGDFQVDYQDTSSDFWRLIPPLKPVILLSFGRSYEDNSWEIELVTHNLANWLGDFLSPTQPTPSPPDASLASNAPRKSVISGVGLVDELAKFLPSLNPFVDQGGAGGYLCEFLGYHLSWYRDLYPDQVKIAAHTHIGSANALSDLEAGVEITLRKLISEMSGGESHP